MHKLRNEIEELRKDYIKRNVLLKDIANTPTNPDLKHKLQELDIKIKHRCSEMQNRIRTLVEEENSLATHLTKLSTMTKEVENSVDGESIRSWDIVKQFSFMAAAHAGAEKDLKKEKKEL